MEKVTKKDELVVLKLPRLVGLEPDPVPDRTPSRVAGGAALVPLYTVRESLELMILNVTSKKIRVSFGRSGGEMIHPQSMEVHVYL